MSAVWDCARGSGVVGGLLRGLLVKFVNIGDFSSGNQWFWGAPGLKHPHIIFHHRFHRFSGVRDLPGQSPAETLSQRLRLCDENYPTGDQGRFGCG